jgi:nicotinate-nucleotide pyrophosphorylase (carboxylating)
VITTSTAELLRGAGLDVTEVERVVTTALAEDLGDRGDLTSTATIPVYAVLTGAYVCREPGVVAGLPVLAAIVDYAAPDARLDVLIADGTAVAPGTRLAMISGAAHAVLALERTSLNLLSHLSGVATITRRWVDAVDGTPARIRDTRKTLPGLRDLQKYAVRCGGGVNHRRGLWDAVLIKDNHIDAAGGIDVALKHANDANADPVIVQIEVDDLDQLDEALAAGARQILLDNFTDDDCREAIRRIRTLERDVIVEASGGLTLDRAPILAATGVDYLSVGALTHSAAALDIGLDVIRERPRIVTP